MALVGIVEVVDVLLLLVDVLLVEVLALVELLVLLVLLVVELSEDVVDELVCEFEGLVEVLGKFDWGAVFIMPPPHAVSSGRLKETSTSASREVLN